MQEIMPTYSHRPEEAGANHLCSLRCLLEYVNDQAIDDSNAPLIGITEAALALLEKIRSDIEKEMAPLKGLNIVRYNKSQENVRAGVANKFIGFEVQEGANFEIRLKETPHA